MTWHSSDLETFVLVKNARLFQPPLNVVYHITFCFQLVLSRIGRHTQGLEEVTDRCLGSLRGIKADTSEASGTLTDLEALLRSFPAKKWSRLSEEAATEMRQVFQEILDASLSGKP